MVPFSIVWCRSEHTGREFPIARFSGDVDYVTDGFESLTSINGPEVVITTLTSAEYRERIAGASHACEDRVNRQLGRTDLRISGLVRVVDHCQPPVIVYRDILATDGEAVAVRTESRRAFQRAGGKILVLTR